MQSRDITVVIPTYNGLLMLKRTLASLEKQTPDSGFFRTVVVDDCSTDGTGDFLRSYMGDLKLKPVFMPRNSGRAAARNAGMKAVDSELALFIDGDMEFDEELVAGHAAKHKGNNHVILGKVVYDKSLPNRGYRRYIETRGASKLPPGTPLPGRYFWSGHVSMPKKLFEAIDGFDDNFSVHGGEDLDFGMRVTAAGFEMIYAPDLIVKHLHVRCLNDVLSTSREYGRSSVPRLVEKHPELYQQLRLDWLDKTGISGIVKRVLLSAPVFRLVSIFGYLLNNVAAPAKLYDYLIFRSYYKGFCEGYGNLPSAKRD